MDWNKERQFWAFKVPQAQVRPAGLRPEYHKFHRVQGGLLAVTLKREGARTRILFEHREVMGRAAYPWSSERSA